MKPPVLVARLKRALAVLRHADRPEVAGVAVAIEAAGQRLLLTEAGVAADQAEGRARFVNEPPPQLLAVDVESQLGLLSLPPDSSLEPLSRLAVAPLPDGEELVAVGAGATLRLAGHRVRHLWLTRTTLVAGRLHSFVDGQKQEEFGYLLDLAPGLLPPGSPVCRREDGALAALVARSPGPAPGLTVARPLREAVALAETLRAGGAAAAVDRAGEGGPAGVP